MKNGKNTEQIRGKTAGFRIFYKYVIQLVLLFDTESWVVTSHMGWYLRELQDHVVR